MQSSCQDLPLEVLIKIFGHLERHDLYHCFLVSRQWNRAAQDNFLWKRLFYKDFKPQVSVIRDQNSCWQAEYQRLRNSVPTKHWQTLTQHTDEVLHVNFSHDGVQLVSCSKDNQFIVWTLDPRLDKFCSHFVQDMQVYQWKHTWASQFNRDDSLLMVSGVVSDVSGEVCIFSTGRGRGVTDEDKGHYSFLCRIINDPYDMLGCWCNEEYFLSSTLHSEEDGIVTSVWLCRANSSGNNEQVMNLENSIKALFKFKNNILLFARFLQIYRRKNIIESDSLWSSSALPTVQVMQEDAAEEEEVNLPGNQNQNLSEETHQIIDEQQCLIFICSDKTIVPHQIGFQRISQETLDSSTLPDLWTSPEKVIEMNGHIVGIALDPEHKELLVNLRSWPENCVPDLHEPPCIATKIELKTICLSTLTIIPNKTYIGHQGFTASDGAFYLYLDIGKNFVASGSEDRFGYVWDRHYGCIVGKLAHEKCVNSVAFHPLTEAIAATASDDSTIKLWRTIA